jgi:hypothetical protein
MFHLRWRRRAASPRAGYTSRVLGRLKAFVLLAVSLLVTVTKRLFSRGVTGLAAFRQNYDADGLPPVTAAERALMPGFERCIACGLCDRGEADRVASSGGAYRGVMALMLAGSRSMPDYRAAAYSFSFVPDEVLAEKERLCPTGVPMRHLARFVRDKANAVGGPLPLPPRVSSLPPRGV